VASALAVAAMCSDTNFFCLRPTTEKNIVSVCTSAHQVHVMTRSASVCAAGGIDDGLERSQPPLLNGATDRM
jgi:hypothetical protein